MVSQRIPGYAKDIQANVDKYDAVWKAQQLKFYATGHAGVPNLSFRGEPFFGQDRFHYLFFRLRQNGLTMRDEPIPPFVKKPSTMARGDLSSVDVGTV